MKKLLLLLILLVTGFGVNAQCDYTINMTDSWGDGWAGSPISSIDVNVAGVITNVTLGSGLSSGSVNIPSTTGDVVTFTWNSGQYDGEVGFDILAPDGSSLFTQGASPTAGLLLTNTSNSTCAPPACPSPNTQTVASITATSANLGWTTGGATDVVVEWGLAGFTQGTGTFVVTTTGSNPYALMGLSGSTDYQWYIKDSCAVGSASAWTGPNAFTTALAPTMVTCGVAVNTTDCYVTGTISEWLFEAASGTDSLEIVVNAGQVENNYDEFEVYDGADASAPLLYSGYGTSGDLAGLTFNGSGNQLYVRITPDSSGDCVSNTYTSLDFDVDCFVPPSCLAPTAQATTGITATSA
ncbi:MAG: hypothetical protein ACI8ZX_001135, partial [Planctomycetota bacterium]